MVRRVGVVFPPLELSRDFIDYPYFADLGALQAAAVLRAAGHEVSVVDALACSGADLRALPDNQIEIGVSVREVLSRIEPELDVIIVAFTPFHRPPGRDRLLGELLEGLRRSHPQVSVLLADLYQSGQHVVDVPSSQLLEAYPEVDGVLRYEAEDQLLALVERLADGRPEAPISENGQEIQKLDELAIPAWDLVDTAAYFSLHEAIIRDLGRPNWAFPIDEHSLPLVTTRGCPFRCTHCSSNAGLAPGKPKTQRRYSLEYLAKHLDFLVAMGARRVHLLDELANVNERHFDGLLELLAARDLKFEIPNGVRADYVLDVHLEAMRGHLTTLSVSAESGVQRVVDEVVCKDLDLVAVTSTAERAGALGVPLLVHFMIGLPGETREEINGTLQYALDLHEAHGAWPSVQFATPLPGTRLAAEAARSGKVLPMVADWGPHFQARPSVSTPEFELDDLVAFKRTFDSKLSASQGARKIIMNVTYKCNNKCTFCAVGTRTQFDGDFERQRELLVKHRKQGVTLLDLDGGEPTMNPNLFPLVGFARRLGYEKVNVTTNGRMAVYDKYASELVNSGITTLLFSLHGPTRHIHAANVGVVEAFDQTLDAIRNCNRLKPDGLTLGVNITLTRSNIRHLEEFARLVHDDLDIHWMNVQFLTPFGRATSTVNPDTQAAADATMAMIDRWKDRINFQVINLSPCFMPGYEKYVLGDLLKLERLMLFVDNEEVNLFEYLKAQREYREQCAGCVHRVFCGGFYKMDDVPEPEWLIKPQDLVRPIVKEGLTSSPRERGERVIPGSSGADALAE